MAACLASILEVPITAIPDPPSEPGESDSTGWTRKRSAWQAFLASMNLGYLELGPIWRPPGYSIMGVTSSWPDPRDPAKPLLHALVALDGRPVWDPHPLREPTLDWVASERIVDWTIFPVLDPSKPAGRASWVSVL